MIAELKLTNNPCKYCNKEIGEGEPICGDIVNMLIMRDFLAAYAEFEKGEEK